MFDVTYRYFTNLYTTHSGPCLSGRSISIRESFLYIFLFWLRTRKIIHICAEWDQSFLLRGKIFYLRHCPVLKDPQYGKRKLSLILSNSWNISGINKIINRFFFLFPSCNEHRFELWWIFGVFYPREYSFFVRHGRGGRGNRWTSGGAAVANYKLITWILLRVYATINRAISIKTAFPLTKTVPYSSALL